MNVLRVGISVRGLGQRNRVQPLRSKGILLLVQNDHDWVA